MPKKISKTLLLDLEDLFKAKKPSDLKRFKVPEWFKQRERVRLLRKKLKVSQSQFARAIHVSVKTVQYWEQKAGVTGPEAVLLGLLEKHPELYKELA